MKMVQSERNTRYNRYSIKNKGILIVTTFLMTVLLLTGCKGGQNNESGSQDAQNIQTTEAGALSDEAAALTESSLTDASEEDDALQEVSTEAQAGDVIEIKEKVFATMCDDIYLNTDEYLGKTIKLEGMADESLDETYNETIYSVYRTSPGCCGNDGWSGFEYVYDGDKPKANDWIEVVGVLESYELDGQEYLRLRADSVTVKDERGAEFVLN